jgi:F-box-like
MAHTDILPLQFPPSSPRASTSRRSVLVSMPQRSPSSDCNAFADTCHVFDHSRVSVTATSQHDHPSSDLARLAYAHTVPSGSVANLSIPHLRQALSILESDLASLLTKRDEIESHLEQAVRSQTPSPIYRLPCELLASIFIMGVLHAEEEDSLMLSALMLVCRYWHDVAVNTPFLWSKITVGNHHSLQKARRKLSRSKSVPLDICVDFSARYDHEAVTTENIIRAMDLLSPYARRWKYFHLSVPNRHQAHVALSRCKDQASLLEVFSVRIFHSMQEDRHSNTPLPLFEGSTPRLRSCSFASFHCGWETSLMRNLRVLKLDGYWNGFAPSPGVLLGILQACPEIEELGLRNMSDIMESRSVPGADLIQLSRLTKASFYYSGFYRTQSVLSRLSLPALQRVELCYLEDINPLLELLHRQSLTSLPLRHLRIESGFFNEHKLVELLYRLPSLTTLELVDVEDVSSNLLKVRVTSYTSLNSAVRTRFLIWNIQVLSAPPVAQSWICPGLCTLSLEGCTPDWDRLRNLVESRFPAHARAYPRHLTSSCQSLTDLQSSTNAAGFPARLQSLDLTRSHISKEMLQWLRMYVSEVKCDTSKGVWGDPCS